MCVYVCMHKCALCVCTRMCNLTFCGALCRCRQCGAAGGCGRGSQGMLWGREGREAKQICRRDAETFRQVDEVVWKVLQ